MNLTRMEYKAFRFKPLKIHFLSLNKNRLNNEKGVPTMSYITTYTGKHFNPIQPNPNLLCIEDIAHALSLLCRGNGHVKTFFSVGEHCIACAKEAKARGLSKRMILACLLHDASECYMSDVPRPLKKILTEYNQQERKLLDCIYTHFLGSPLTQTEQDCLNDIDNAFLWYDLSYLLNEPQPSPKPELHIIPDYKLRPFQEVEAEYLQIYKDNFSI